MSGLKIIANPAITPVSRIEARQHLRLDDDVDDSQVRSYIQAVLIGLKITLIVSLSVAHAR